jgi:hypothetical protein
MRESFQMFRPAQSSPIIPNFAVQGDTAIKERTLRNEGIGLWLIVACKLQCFSGRLKKFASQGQAPAIKLFASVPSLTHAPPRSLCSYPSLLRNPGLSSAASRERNEMGAERFEPNLRCSPGLFTRIELRLLRNALLDQGPISDRLAF